MSMVDIGELPVVAHFLENPWVDWTTVDFGKGFRTWKEPSVVRLGEFREQIVWYGAQGERDFQIARERVGYIRGTGGLIVKRWTLREWFNSAGNVATPYGAPVVSWSPKLYSSTQAVAAGKRRRENNLDSLKDEFITAIAALYTGGDSAAAQAIGVAYMGTFNDEGSTTDDAFFSLYKSSGNPVPLINRFTTDTEPWLDLSLDALITFGWLPHLEIGNTIRDLLLYRMQDITAFPDEPWTADVKAGPPS